MPMNQPYKKPMKKITTTKAPMPKKKPMAKKAKKGYGK